jgi:large subunit ribosomal protein L15
MKLHNLKAPAPNRKTPKRVGRGEGSGLGKQSGRGHKGQKAGSGYSRKVSFEGGQMPLQRRVPKFGFNNPFRVEYKAINLDLIQERFAGKKDGDTIGVADFINAGLVSKKDLVKVLGRGEITSKFEIEAHAFSATAIEKIEKAGGKSNTIK